MYKFKFNPKSKNFRNRFEAHLKRCKEFYMGGGTLHNSVDYFFSLSDTSSTPNFDVDFNIKHHVNYSMCENHGSYGLK